MSSTRAVPPADILMLIPNLGLGGAQRVFAEHSRLFAERYRVADVAFNDAGGEHFPSGNPLLTLDVAGGGSVMDKARHFTRRVAALRRIKQASGARLCISHMPGADYVNLFSKSGERTITVVHGSRKGDRAFAGLSGMIQNSLLLPVLYRRADRIVPVSAALTGELLDFGVDRGRLRTINNFFDHQTIIEMAAVPLRDEEKRLFADAPVLISSGRLHPQKNQLALLDVIAQLRNDPPTRTIILGDGELREALVQRAEALNLKVWAAWRDQSLVPGYDLYLLGARDNPFQWLRRADLFVLPSSWEGFPLALCEAMICGVPVISADCPTGPREILAPGSGAPPIMQNREDADCGMLMPLLPEGGGASPAVRIWVKTLARLLNEPARAKQLAAAGQRRMAGFTRARVGAQWFALIEEVLAGSARSDA